MAPSIRGTAVVNTPEFARVEEYYQDADVRARIHEYCGGTRGVDPTAAYLSALYPDGTRYLTWERATRVPVSRYDDIVRRGPDLSRALWDTRHLIFVLDLDYLNVDAQADAFLHPAETFVKLEPMYAAIGGVLDRFGIAAFRLMTGRGYHFVGRIPLGHPVTERLAALVRDTPPWHDAVAIRRPAGVTAVMRPLQARAATGLGLLTEYLAHLSMRGVTCQIPVVVNGTVVGRGERGRECVSLDFSYAGDPLDVRTIRVGFGAYQWHRFRPDIFGEAAQLPALAALPRGRRPLIPMLVAGRDLAVARRAARKKSARLPDVSAGIARLLARYRRSRLAVFHRRFLDVRGDGQPQPLGELPPCVKRAFARPNDLLLKPEFLQHVVRALMSRDWSPREIADAVAACYAADWNWGPRWTWMDRQTRADFDVRVFAGMIVTGLDRMPDFNCASSHEKDVCPGVGCSYDLRLDRDRLLALMDRS
jgi:hypothetical protein